MGLGSVHGRKPVTPAVKKTTVGGLSVKPTAAVTLKPSTLKSKWKVGTSHAGEPILLDAINEVLSGERGDEWPTNLRASAAAGWCPRAECIEHCFGEPEHAIGVSTMMIPGGEPHPLNLLQTFMTGTAVHHFAQNEILGKAGKLVGKWVCVGCGTEWGMDKPATWIHHPGWLESKGDKEDPTDIKNHDLWQECDCTRFELAEAYSYSEAIHCAGHIDGGIYLPSGELAGLEIKTISEKQFTDLLKPKAEHKVQSAIYCHLFGVKKMVFLYWSKGWHPEVPFRKGMPAFPRMPLRDGGWQWGGLKEFVVEPDPKIVTRLLARRAEVTKVIEEHEAGESPDMPSRISMCKTPTSARCKSCLVADACWELA